MGLEHLRGQGTPEGCRPHIPMGVWPLAVESKAACHMLVITKARPLVEALCFLALPQTGTAGPGLGAGTQAEKGPAPQSLGRASLPSKVSLER